MVPGGLASYNHPFGFEWPPELPIARQDAMLVSVAKKLLATSALATDIIEVG